MCSRTRVSPFTNKLTKTLLDNYFLKLASSSEPDCVNQTPMANLKAVVLTNSPLRSMPCTTKVEIIIVSGCNKYHVVCYNSCYEGTTKQC